jgi:transcriptional regulator with XRE-family HTH domain
MCLEMRGGVMTAKHLADQPAEVPPRTLAEKVTWLIDQARPAGRGTYSNAEVVALIEKATGEQFSHTTIWKLRNGQATNPQMRLLDALSRTFRVPPAFFFDDYDDKQAAELGEQLELLTLLRETGVTTDQLSSLLELSPAALQAVADLVRHATRTNT